jgi:ADP-ribose pyrophosphatase YjhB (NUDIX family)
MSRSKDAFCSYCGTKFAEPLRYPRTCSNADCAITVWANPIPVAVVLAPIVRSGRTGLLVVRRGIEPQKGKLALVGGFVEEHERWQVGAAREVREETSIEIDAARIEPFTFVSTEPRPNRILLFCTAAPLDAASLPPLAPTHETEERGVIYGPGGLDDVFAFPLHAAAAKKWLEAKGLTGPHAYETI